MGKLDRFDIVLNNPEEAYFAGQEISGKVVIEVKEPKKVNEILLELKGRARTYWTKHSGLIHTFLFSFGPILLAHSSLSNWIFRFFRSSDF
ncbi:arrestin domain protein [Ancylostoma caninum]|uniref:Arrestin domain protein n=1 Tax=Ancylostoma caninum TaxID=29170 RepID=A0A368G8T7_ANCCA|nr:arrestin domain protein [Ancylostoma caninum]